MPPPNRALVSVTVTPDQQFTLTPPSMLNPTFGYRPRPFSFGIPPLTLGGSPVPNYSPSLGGVSLGSGSSGSSQATTSGGQASTGTTGDKWQVLGQTVVQLNPANLSFTHGVAAPLAATTLQFNLLFGGFNNKFQFGEYISGSGSFVNDAQGRVYSMSYGVLIGGNDLLVRGPLSFINPQLQVGPNFTNLGRPDASAQIAANISNFINFGFEGTAMTVGVGGQIGYVYDFSANQSAFSASLLLQFQLQKLLDTF